LIRVTQHRTLKKRKPFLSPRVMETIGDLREKRKKRVYQPSKLLEKILNKFRPVSRRDCINGPRPCPWVGCRYHLYLDVLPSGSIRHSFPTLEIWELKETCSLDVAERRAHTLDEIGLFLNCTRENVRLIEKRALKKFSALLKKSNIIIGASKWSQTSHKK